MPPLVPSRQSLTLAPRPQSPTAPQQHPASDSSLVPPPIHCKITEYVSGALVEWVSVIADNYDRLPGTDIPTFQCRPSGQRGNISGYTMVQLKNHHRYHLSHPSSNCSKTIGRPGKELLALENPINDEGWNANRKH